MSKHPLLLHQLLYLLETTKRGKVTDLQLGDLHRLHHHLEVADGGPNEVELCREPALPIRVAVAVCQHL